MFLDAILVLVCSNIELCSEPAGLTKYVSYIDPRTRVSKAPQPSPWNILAVMHCP